MLVFLPLLLCEATKPRLFLVATMRRTREESVQAEAKEGRKSVVFRALAAEGGTGKCSERPSAEIQ